MPTADPHHDFSLMTERQRAIWSSGDFQVMARAILPASEILCEAADLRPAERVLDVACGTGNVALIAARRYCDVTGIDFVPALLERARRRADAEGTAIDFREADAQALPFADASFDAVLSCFGVIFAPDQDRAAAELLRVCRPGGRIAIACWMPEGIAAESFRALAPYAPPPPGLEPPTRWGTVEGLESLLGAGVESIATRRRRFLQYFRSVEHGVEVAAQNLGPLARALASLEADRRAALLHDFAAMYERLNRATDGTLALDSEFLVAVCKRA